MLKQAAFFLAFFIFLVAAFVIGERSFSPVFQCCIDQNKNTNAGATAKENPATFGTVASSYGGITALATLIIAAFTGTLWVSTSKQARLTRESIDLARNEFISTWRPKLRVRNIVAEGGEEFPLLTPGRPLIGKLQVVNIGGTTAKIKQGRIIVFWNESGLPMELPYARSNIGVYLPEASLAPGKSIEPAFQSDATLPANVGTISTGVIGQLHLYVMGSIEYDDESCIRRRTNFCREYRRLNWQIDGRFYPVDDPDYEHEE
jgi:hypothetical protein